MSDRVVVIEVLGLSLFATLIDFNRSPIRYQIVLQEPDGTAARVAPFWPWAPLYVFVIAWGLIAEAAGLPGGGIVVFGLGALIAHATRNLRNAFQRDSFPKPPLWRRLDRAAEQLVRMTAIFAAWGFVWAVVALIFGVHSHFRVAKAADVSWIEVWFAQEHVVVFHGLLLIACMFVSPICFTLVRRPYPRQLRLLAGRC